MEIFKKTVGARILKWPVWFSFYFPGIGASWFCDFVLYREKLTITILEQKFELYYCDIDFIDKKLFSIRIHHHSNVINPYIYISGSGTSKKLFNEIKECIKSNNLPILIK